MTEYPYTKSTVNLTRLTLEIEDSVIIVTTLQYINWVAPDSLSIFFDGTLSGPEVTELNALVAAHGGTPPTNYEYFCYCCGKYRDEDALSKPTQCCVCSSTDIQDQYTKTNLEATTNPTINDDETTGYCIGSFWINTSTGHCFECVDPTDGAAVWHELVTLETDGVLKIYDTTGAESMNISRNLNYAVIDAGIGADDIRIQVATANIARFHGTYVSMYKDIRPNSDGLTKCGTDALRFSEGNFDLVRTEGVTIQDPTHAEEASITRDLSGMWIDAGTGGTQIIMKCNGVNVAGFYTNKLTVFKPIEMYNNMYPLADGSYSIGEDAKRFGAGYIDTVYTEGLTIQDPTHVESGTITRSLSYLNIDCGAGALLSFSVNTSQYIKMGSGYIQVSQDFYPISDSNTECGISTRHWSGVYSDNYYVGDGNLIQTKESLGVTAQLKINIPVGAGGAAAAALDHQIQLDGILEAGLLAETDGAGSYREPVFKLPHYSADYGADWASPPNPTPTSLTGGCSFTAHNTDDDTYRIYSYINGAWRSSELT